jgi:nucleoid-associated protein YgaU
MAKQSDFSKQAWGLLKDGPEWVFAALAAADGNVALTLKMKESKAFKKAVEGYRSRSELMAEVLEDTSKAAKATKSATLSDAVEAIEKINDILDSQVSPSEAAEYRRFLLSIAEDVAGATGEGALGLGEKFSDKEKNAMAKIRKALKPEKKAAKPAAAKVEKKVVKKVVKKETKPMKEEKETPKPKRRPVRPAAAKKIDQVSAKFEKAKVIATHKVEGNQTLSHIALKYYKNATRPYWKLIHEFNKGVIGDDEKNIWEGLELKIPELPDELKG